MDSNDLFKRLTTNLRFESSLTSSTAAKRKLTLLDENEPENKFDPKRIKTQPPEESTTPPASTKLKNKTKKNKKKKNLFLINQENVKFKFSSLIFSLMILIGVCFLGKSIEKLESHQRKRRRYTGSTRIDESTIRHGCILQTLRR